MIEVLGIGKPSAEIAGMVWSDLAGLVWSGLLAVFVANLHHPKTETCNYCANLLLGKAIV